MPYKYTLQQVTDSTFVDIRVRQIYLAKVSKQE